MATSKHIYHTSDLNDSLKCSRAAAYNRALREFDIPESVDKRAANIGIAAHSVLELILIDRMRPGEFHQWRDLILGEDDVLEGYIEHTLIQYGQKANRDVSALLLEDALREKILQWVKGYLQDDPYLVHPQVFYLPELNFVCPVGHYLIGGRADALRLRPRDGLTHSEAVNYRFDLRTGAKNVCPARYRQLVSRRHLMFEKQRIVGIQRKLRSAGLPYQGNEFYHLRRNDYVIDLIDYKTGANAPSPFYLRNNLQFDMYAYALLNGFWFRAKDRLDVTPQGAAYYLFRDLPDTITFWKISDYQIRTRKSTRAADAMTAGEREYYLQKGAVLVEDKLVIPAGTQYGKAHYSATRSSAETAQDNIISSIRAANSPHAARYIPAFMPPCDMCRWNWLCDNNIKPTEARNYLQDFTQ